MTKILVLYHSRYGHVRSLAEAEAEGAASISGTHVDLRRIPDVTHASTDPTPAAAIEDLANYDAIILGTPTHFGTMAGEVKMFLDQATGLWTRNAMAGKVGAVFTSTGSQHGGHEATLLSTQIPFFHLGMIMVGLPYTYPRLTETDDVFGGAPYGAGTIAGADGSRSPVQTELDGARFQGAHVAQVTSHLVAGRHALLAA